MKHLPLAKLALVLGLASACKHTYESAEGPSDEQKLDLYITTATYLYEDDSLTRAQDQAVKALELEPDNLPMRRMIGWIRLRLGSNEDLIIAEQFFRELIDEGDENRATMLGLATTVERLGTAYDYAAGQIASGEREPTEEGRDAQAEAEELALQARDHWNEALELYHSTLTGGEGSTSALNGLQRTYALLRRYEESLDWADRLLERSQEELDAWRRMLQAEELTEKEESLFRENERTALRLQTETRLFAAGLLYRLGRYPEGIVHLNVVVEETPDLAQVYSLRAQLRSKVGDFEDAIADLDQFLRLSDAPFEDPVVQRAFELRTDCETELRKLGAVGPTKG